ncbi:Manganese/iron superoxide dismutase [Thalassoporum mexicanum PCC 7367]|uniref:superoxide dismutase n=1 Tax=Thalassoporum mexicanum TaxID=3457544 RepID=UPI00029FB92D|nr:Manganese/iron superoxide dismutase [Pseudanabaena sp. PCC 7367]
MKRRDFLTWLGVGVGTLAIANDFLLSPQAAKAMGLTGSLDHLLAQADTPDDPFTLPPLPYDYNALEPHIDVRTMQIHHDRHHAGYVRNLNKAIATYPDLAGMSAEDMLRDLTQVPEPIRTTVRNNAGGHVNHSMFWEIMSPNGGGTPTGAIAAMIAATFGNFENLQTAFNQAGASRFGSGWAWLVLDKQGNLKVTSTANQDSPLLEGLFPIMGNDVWEHAYYLNYQNRRGDYLKAWWNLVNWEEVNNRFLNAMV